ncbi:RrF2 family transcriptional regulator [[Clostridium] polysaccharolyticum]|uniref:Transcriptional regulator, BadM/Rrf2 family n=1 Tax=[Clostridium] polysaccharolyticum TaxID=29364 RepID=A0A1H9ZXW2_9FIRM|nr:Rrf2 family transcriptional regulator [[Clostridium] polysaccharolyticum]SES86647.1 transcriptional regulator, BadM/Rrf2 family [[Clostridium] polysaccharolyticum]
MKISTKGRYGLRAVLDLAMNSETEAVSLSSIAERQHISVSYLEQLVSKLRKAGIVNSIRGAQGGYVLAKPANEISVGDILRALEGDLHPVDCAEVSGGESVCEGAGLCVSKFVWKRISDSISQAVDTLMLSDLAEEGKALLSKQAEEGTKDKPYCH